MRLRPVAHSVIHRVMHRPRGKQGLDFRVLVQCTMASLIGKSTPSVRPAEKTRHASLVRRLDLFHSGMRAATHLPRPVAGPGDARVTPSWGVDVGNTKEL